MDRPTRILTFLSGIWVFICLGTAALAPRPEMKLELTLAPPSSEHLWGCDPFGSDLLLSVIEAGRLSLFFSFISALCISVIALFLSASALTASERPRRALLSVLDVWLAFPSLIVALILVAWFGPSPLTLLLALVVGFTPSITRTLIARGEEILSEDYWKASTALGASRLSSIRNHVLPELLRFLLIKVPSLFSGALLAEASLTFLGVGVPRDHPSWGGLILMGKDYLIEAPHIVFFSGLPLLLTVALILLWSERLTARFTHR